MLSAVISKMNITSSRDFGKSGWLTVLNCICQNDLMAAYAEPGHEDRCFTKHSPWGEAQVGHSLLSGPVDCFIGRSLYVVAVRGETKPRCPGALLVVRARVGSITDNGDGQAKIVEVLDYGGNEPGLRIRTAIDNPPAVAFFEPGKMDYWVVFYDATTASTDEAVADALTE
jgi:hypothetical protein